MRRTGVALPSIVVGVAVAIKRGRGPAARGGSALAARQALLAAADELDSTVTLMICP